MASYVRWRALRPFAIPRRLNVSSSRRSGIVNYLLLKIANHNVKCAAGEQISRSIVKTRLGKLPVGGGAREIGNGETGNKHYKGENNDKGSALGFSFPKSTK